MALRNRNGISHQTLYIYLYIYRRSIWACFPKSIYIQPNKKDGVLQNKSLVTSVNGIDIVQPQNELIGEFEGSSLVTYLGSTSSEYR